jgi:hypothetical protein
MTDKIDSVIDQMFALREAKRALESDIKQLNKEYLILNDWLMERYKDIGTTTGRGTLASATLTETTVPNIEDWGEVCDWIKENDAMYLCHRRISAGPWKELMDSGETVRGISSFTKRAISLTKLRD